MRTFLKLFALVLCLALIISMAIACRRNDKIYDDYQSGNSTDDGNTDFVTAPPVETEEDDAYIDAAPANDEQGWGPLTPRP